MEVCGGQCLNANLAWCMVVSVSGHIVLIGKRGWDIFLKG
jgi:hypothetical protein